MRNTGSTAAGRRRRPRAMRWAVVAVAVLWAVSPARAVRKCCPGPDEVLVARTAAAEMQCARGGRLSAAVWARGDAAAAPAGPPPGCAGALAVDVWVLSADAAAAAAPDVSPAPMEQPPARWWQDEGHFCLEAAQLADRRNNLSARAVAVGCLPRWKAGSEDGGAGAVATNASDGGSGSGSGLAEATEVLLGAPALPPEPLWTGGEMLWVDVVNSVPEPESSAPWSSPPPSPSAPADAKGAVVRVVASDSGAANLRKCCPRGFGLSVRAKACVALPPGSAAAPFPAARSLRLAHHNAEKEGGLLALLLGPAESLQQGDELLSLACPPDMARTFQVVPFVEVEAVEPSPDATNDSTTPAGGTKEGEADAAQTCVDALAGGGGARAVVVARCAARASACGEGGGGGGSGDRDLACVTKCCPLGQSFVGKRCTRTQAPLQLDFRTSFAESAAPARVALIEKRPRCTEGFVVLEPNKYPDDNWHLQRDGRVFRPLHSKMYTLDGYCVEHANSSLSTGFVLGVHAFICMRPQHMGETKAG